MKLMIEFSNRRSTGFGTETHRRARQTQKTVKQGKIGQNPVCNQMKVDIT